MLHEPARLALLVLVAMARQGWLPRVRVCQRLWPDVPTGKAKNRLRQAIHRLRELLGPSAILSHGNGDLEVNRRVVTLDAVRFRELRSRGEHAKAMAIYRGPFLDEFVLDGRRDFEDWAHGVRIGLQEDAVASLRFLAQQAEAAGRVPEALAWWKRDWEIGFVDEEALQGQLRCLIRQGARTKAVHLYDEGVKRLRSELGVGPSPETARLVRSP